MLSIGKLASAEYYLASVAAGVEDYYTGAGEAPGVWMGTGAGLLGLSGQVAAEDLRAVLGGQDPAGAPLVSGKAAAKGRLPGFDLTMSAPKSVTLLFALGDEAVADATRAAHDEAVAEALGYLEAEAAQLRRGHDGLAVEAAGGLVAAGFRHRTSRAGDPQLHTHVLVANLAPSAEGRWSALDGRAVYAHARTAGFLYQAALRAALTQRLGVRWGPVRRGMAEVAGFSREELAAFSTRRAEIAAAMAEHHSSTAAGAQAAALDTRRAKDRSQRIDAAPLSGARDYRVEPPALVEQWRARGVQLGLSAEVVAGRTGPGRPARPLDEAAVGDVLVSPGGLTAQASSFDRRDVLRGLAEAAGEGASVAALRDAASRFLSRRGLVRLEGADRSGHLASPDVIRLGSGKVVAGSAGGERWTTAELLAVEADLVTRARAGTSAGVGVAEPDALRAALAARPTLAGEQAAMVRRLTTSGAGIEVVIGAAGTGKTFALDAARAAWAASGVTVTGAALSARAAEELAAGSGIASGTLSQLLLDVERNGPRAIVPPGSVLVCDEAGMVGTRTLERLARVVSEAGAKLVLVGDPRQLPAIDAGGGLAALASRVGAVYLVDNRRQAEAWERTALGELRAGRAAEAVAAYGTHGRVHLAPSADAAMLSMVADWASARAAGQTPVMLARRRDSVERLNALARAARVASGELTGPEVVSVGGVRYAVGDEVVGLRNDRRVGFLNGTRATVTALDADARTLSVGWTDARTGDRMERLLPAGYVDRYLALGYAMTGYKAQGMTTGRALVLADDAMTGEAGYVAMSRGRTANDLYWVAPQPPAGRAPQHDSLDELARTLVRSGAKSLAVEGLSRRPVDSGRTVAELEEERGGLGAFLHREAPPRPADELAGARRWLAEAEDGLAAAEEWRERATRAWESEPRRHRAQRAALVGQIEAAGVAGAEWAAQVDMRRARLIPIEAAQATWDRWVEARAEQVERFAQLGEALGARREALVTAAALDRPRWLREALGPEPAGWSERFIWRHAVAEVVVWRDRAGIDDPERMAGPAQIEPRLAQLVANTARSLGHSLSPELARQLGIDHGWGLEP